MYYGHTMAKSQKRMDFGNFHEFSDRFDEKKPNTNKNVKIILIGPTNREDSDSELDPVSNIK